MSTVHRRRKSQAASFCRTNLRECLSCITAGSTNTQPRPKRSISWSAFEVNSQAWLRRDWRLSFSRKERMGQGTERALLELLSYRTSLHTHLQSVWYSPTWMVQQGTALAEKKLQKKTTNQPTKKPNIFQSSSHTCLLNGELPAGIHQVNAVGNRRRRCAECTLPGKQQTHQGKYTMYYISTFYILWGKSCYKDRDTCFQCYKSIFHYALSYSGY